MSIGERIGDLVYWIIEKVGDVAFAVYQWISFAAASCTGANRLKRKKGKVFYGLLRADALIEAKGEGVVLRGQSRVYPNLSEEGMIHVTGKKDGCYAFRFRKESGWEDLGLLSIR